MVEDMEEKLLSCFRYVKDCIKKADDDTNLSKREALEKIRKVWRGIDDCFGLAEARTRLILGKLDNLVLAEEPEWLKNAEIVLRKKALEEHKINELVFDDAKKLIRACVNLEGYSKLEAEIYPALDGIAVDWKVSPDAHQWIVSPTMNVWPMVYVHALNSKAHEKHSTETEVFHDALGVIDYFKDRLSYLKKE